MTNQYINDRPLLVGSVDVRVALYSDTTATYETAKSIGMLDGNAFKVTGAETIIETDNAPDINLGLSNQQAEFSASAWKNLDLETLFLIMGRTGTFTSKNEEDVDVEGEFHTAPSGEIGVRLENKNGTYPASVVSDIVVASEDGTTTYQVDTDYVVNLDSGGYTVLMFGGAITDGAVVKVSYTYTSPASSKMTYGSSLLPVTLQVWLTNIDAQGRKFQIKLHKVESIKSQEISFGSDKAKGLVSMPISLIGKPDPTRPAEDDLFSIYNEQGV